MNVKKKYKNDISKEIFADDNFLSLSKKLNLEEPAPKKERIGWMFGVAGAVACVAIGAIVVGGLLPKNGGVESLFKIGVVSNEKTKKAVSDLYGGALNETQKIESLQDSFDRITKSVNKDLEEPEEEEKLVVNSYQVTYKETFNLSCTWNFEEWFNDPYEDEWDFSMNDFEQTEYKFNFVNSETDGLLMRIELADKYSSDIFGFEENEKDSVIAQYQDGYLFTDQTFNWGLFGEDIDILTLKYAYKINPNKLLNEFSDYFILFTDNACLKPGSIEESQKYLDELLADNESVEILNSTDQFVELKVLYERGEAYMTFDYQIGLFTNIKFVDTSIFEEFDEDEEIIIDKEKSVYEIEMSFKINDEDIQINKYTEEEIDEYYVMNGFGHYGSGHGMDSDGESHSYHGGHNSDDYSSYGGHGNRP